MPLSYRFPCLVYLMVLLCYLVWCHIYILSVHMTYYTRMRLHSITHQLLALSIPFLQTLSFFSQLHHVLTPTSIVFTSLHLSHYQGIWGTMNLAYSTLPSSQHLSLCSLLSHPCLGSFFGNHVVSVVVLGLSRRDCDP